MTVKTLGRRILTPVLGKVRFQKLFQILYEVSLAGLNFGEGAQTQTSGELYVLKYIQQKISESRTNQPITIFDVGANVGEYSKLLLNHFGKTADIWAFEPSPVTFKKLLSELQYVNNIHLLNFGFGDIESRTKLYSLGEGSKSGSVYKRKLDHKGWEMSFVEDVKIRTIDSFCHEQGIGHINVLKLDVEGHELKVLEGAKKMHEQGKIDFIQFEFGSPHVDSRTFFCDFYYFLTEHGYKVFRVLQDGLYPIQNYRHVYEVFKRATNYFAEKCPTSRLH